MTGQIIQFPGDPDAMKPGDVEQILLHLHARLLHALEHNQKTANRIRIVLSIDDVFEMCELIERHVGPEYFDDGQDDDE